MDIDLLRNKLNPLFKRKGAEMAILFGSCADRTEDRHSDLDIIIIDNTELPFIKRLDKYFEEIVMSTGMSIDLFVYTQQELEKMKGLPFIDNIMKNGCIIYQQTK